MRLLLLQNIDLEDLNYKVLGEGEPLIILHGLFGMLDNWATVGKNLADRYKVYLIDQRNHGKSFHSSINNYDVLSDDLLQFMDTHHIDKAHILGHSMGGKTVMQFGQKYPERCHSILIVDIAPQKYKESHTEIFDAILSIDLKSINTRKEAEEQLSEHIDEEGVRQFLLKNLGRDADKGFVWKCNFESLYINYNLILSNVIYYATQDIPALFIYGTRSNYVVPSDESDIKKMFSKAEIVPIDAGHWIHAEKPMELIEIIIDFIDKY